MSGRPAMPEDKTPAPPSAEVQSLLDFITANPTKRLTITYPTHTVTEPGSFLEKENTKPAAPIVTFPGADPAKTYVLINIDPDAPAMFGCILHWVQGGVKADSTGKLSAHEPFVANYIGANPPPGSPKPHRYIFGIYEQPASFKTADHAPPGGAEMELMKRAKTDLGALTTKLGLGPVLAGNFYTSL